MRLIDADDLIERINVVIEHGLADRDGLHPVSAEVVLETINVIPSAQPEEGSMDKRRKDNPMQ